VTTDFSCYDLVSEGPTSAKASSSRIYKGAQPIITEVLVIIKAIQYNLSVPKYLSLYPLQFFSKILVILIFQYTYLSLLLVFSVQPRFYVSIIPATRAKIPTILGWREYKV
jgi:hypothetical protein